MTTGGYHFDIGTVFREHGRTYAVIEASRQKRMIRDRDSQEITVRTAAQLHKQYLHGAIELEDLLTSSTERNTARSPTIEKSLAHVSEAAREQVKLKRHYLDSLCPRGRMTCRRNELPHKLTKLYQALAESLPQDRRPPRPPSVSTFYTWRGAWVNSFYSSKSLLNRFDLRGRRPAELPNGLHPILERAVDEFYAKPNRPSLSETLERAEEEVDRLNRLRPPMDQLPRPTRRQLERLIAKRTDSRYFSAATAPRTPARRRESSDARTSRSGCLNASSWITRRWTSSASQTSPVLSSAGHILLC